MNQQHQWILKQEHFWNLIEQLKEDGITILYTSHYIEEVERMVIKLSI